MGGWLRYIGLSVGVLALSGTTLADHSDKPSWTGSWSGTPTLVSPSQETHDCMARTVLLRYRPSQGGKLGQLIIMGVPNCGFRSDMVKPIYVDVRGDGSFAQDGKCVGGFRNESQLQVLFRTPDYKESLDLEWQDGGKTLSLKKVFTLRNPLRSWTVSGTFERR